MSIYIYMLKTVNYIFPFLSFCQSMILTLIKALYAHQSVSLLPHIGPFHLISTPPVDDVSRGGRDFLFFPGGGQKICISKFLKGFANKACRRRFPRGSLFFILPRGVKNLHFKISEGFANKACGRRLLWGEY